MKVLLSWLQDFVDIDIPAEELAERLTMIGLEATSCQKIGDDYLFDFEITPNRPDCLSVLGIAREISVMLSKPLKPVKISYPPHISSASIKEQDFEIKIQEENDCLRYIGRLIFNVEIKDSPSILKERLEKIGLRTINNVVDITNYVLLEMGQPLHAFDYNKIEGKLIYVRKAKKGENLITIDGEKRVLSEEDLVIADAKRPVALAGIMGGKETEVSHNTKNILLESAYFNPALIAHSSRRHGLVTESSYRFERGVDYHNVEKASLRALELIRKYGSRTTRRTTVYLDKEIDLKKKGPPLQNRVNLKFSNIEKIIGILPPSFWIRSILRGLGIDIVAQSRDGFKLEPPSFRKDLKEEIDFIEEIARFYGYQKIPADKLPKLILKSEPNLEKFTTRKEESLARQILKSMGLNEVISYALIDEKELEILKVKDYLPVTNPLTKNFSVLRPTIIPSLLKIAQYNFNRQIYDLAFFELGKIYYLHKIPEERKVIGLLLSGTKYEDYFQNKIYYNFYDLKGIIESFLIKLGINGFDFHESQLNYFEMGNCCEVLKENQRIAILGLLSQELASYYDLKKKIFVAEIYFDSLIKYMERRIKYQNIPVYPYILRDLSIIIDEAFSVVPIIDTIRAHDKLIREVKVIDVFCGKQLPPQKKSITLRIKFQSEERTLQDEEVDKIINEVLTILKDKFAIQLR